MNLTHTQARKKTEISRNLVMGINNPKTLKLRGTINEAPVVAMVNPRATHNFISTILVQWLPVTASKTFGISLGTRGGRAKGGEM